MEPHIQAITDLHASSSLCRNPTGSLMQQVTNQPPPMTNQANYIPYPYSQPLVSIVQVFTLHSSEASLHASSMVILYLSYPAEPRFKELFYAPKQIKSRLNLR